MNQHGDVFEIFFTVLIGIVLLVAFLPIINDLAGEANTAAAAATDLTYMNFAAVIISMFGILLIIFFIRSAWKSSGTPAG